MKLNDSTTRWHYARPAVLLHWMLAPLILGMLALGWYMMSIEDQPGSDWYFDLHKSIGLIVATLVGLRVAWRVTHPPAPLPASVAGWQIKLASATQALLYACMVVVPVAGFTGAAYSKDGIRFFGGALPLGVMPNHDAAELFFTVHGIAVWVLAGLITLHAAGGLKHLLMDRDGVFQRMWW